MSRHPNKPESIWQHVTNHGDPDKCWEWQGYTSKKTGYGRITINYEDKLVHRVAFELNHGEIPSNMCVCHSCDNRICCNPDHLWLGTSTENQQDCTNKGRRVCGSKHWTRLFPEKLACGDSNGTRTNPESLHRGDSHWTRLQPEKVARGERSGQYTHPERTARGERNGNAALTKDQIYEIFALHKLGWTQQQIADKLGIQRAGIGKILRGALWKSITQPLLALIKAGKL